MMEATHEHVADCMPPFTPEPGAVHRKSHLQKMSSCQEGVPSGCHSNPKATRIDLESPAPRMSAADTMPTDEGTARRSGFEARTGLELSVIETRSEFRVAHDISLDPATDEVVEMTIPDRVLVPAIGPLELGYFFAMAHGLGLYPRIAGSWASSVLNQRSEETAGRTYRYRQAHHFWDVTIGGEFLLLDSRLGISFDVGLAQLRPRPQAVEPPDLEAFGRDVAGGQMRLGLSYHTPITRSLGFGATLFVSRFSYPEHSDDPGTLFTHRVGLGTQLEWGRR